LVREPLFWTAGIPSIASYALKWLLKKPGSFPQDDVSVGDWLLAVTGSRSLVDDIASAGIHGIWGGDIYKLSAASVLGWTFQRARHPDVRHNDDVIPASEIEFVERFAEGRPEVYDIWQHARASTMCLGPFGLESLPAAIADTLKSAPNVQFSFNNRIRSIEYDGAQDQIKVCILSLLLEKIERMRELTESPWL
jgi:oxygen-dependent protoporphyrinogen oxidase